MPGGFWWEEVRGTCGEVELVPWRLRFASVGRGSGEVEGQSHGETRCILNLDKSSKEGGTCWITQRKAVLFTYFLFGFFLNHRTQKQHFTRREPVFLRDRQTELPMQNECVAGVCIQDVSIIIKRTGTTGSNSRFSWFVESPIHILSRIPRTSDVS